MPHQNIDAGNGAATDSSTWSERTVLVVGAATGMGQAVVTAFAAAGVHRIALVDIGDMSVTQDRALHAAAANQLAPPDLLTLDLQPEDYACLDQRVEEVSRKWGHVDFIINHANHQPLFVEHSTLNERAVAGKMFKWFETGFKNIYAVIDAFLPLLLAGSEKTFINIIPTSSPVSKPGIGANMIVEMADRQMADCLMVDHGHEGLLAYSIHSSAPTKGMSPSANKGMWNCRRDLKTSGEILTSNS
jgi:NAD(P)-dependent dehydrogenase (short-subunit alcohol dehydrogenase family)